MAVVMALVSAKPAVAPEFALPSTEALALPFLATICALMPAMYSLMVGRSAFVIMLSKALT